MPGKLQFRKLYTGLSLVFIILFIITSFLGYHKWGGLLLMLFFTAVALSLRTVTKLKGFTFTVVIFAAVSLSMYYPQYFLTINGFKLSTLIIPLLQLIMFGMGSELSVNELAQIAKSPKKVFIGVICHYTVMPVIGFLVASMFNFPKAIAAGIILVGCCPSGLASNVMSYLAKANLALSIAITTVSTLLAPLFTPLLMQVLAGRYIKVHFLDMAWDTTRVVIIPIAAGLLFHFLVKGRVKWLDKIMPIVSMIGIGLIIVVITAAGRDSLFKVGILLIVAVLIHNVAGYLLGYWISRAMRFDEKDCRTISLEVGMQNGGLASGLALLMNGMATIGLAPAIFGPLMNVTGSLLANWWHGKTPPEDFGKKLKTETFAT